MDFSVSQAQQELSGLSRRILTDRLTPDRLAELEQAGLGWDEAAWADLAAAGILSAALPENAGGDGYGLAEQCSILIELGRTVAPAPYLESIVLGAGVVARFGSPEQVEHYAYPAAGGELVIAPALAEPGDGEADAPSAEATSLSTGWSLTGTKAAAPYGAAASLFLVTAMTSTGPAIFAVRRDDPGVTVGPQRLLDSPGAAQIEMASVKLPGDRLIGDPDGLATAWLLDRATVGLCAFQLGVTERALELTAEYARTRQAFGRAIGAFQAVAQRLADAYIDVDAIKLTMWQAAWRLETGLPAAEELATAKFWAAEAGHRVAHTAVHIHGGVGIDLSHPLHRYFATAKRTEFTLGSATTHLRHLGAALAG